MKKHCKNIDHKLRDDYIFKNKIHNNEQLSNFITKIRILPRPKLYYQDSYYHSYQILVMVS